jgi:phosphoglucosamine mutase
VKALAAMRSRQLPLHELSRGLKPVPQVLINIQVAEKPAIESLPSIAALIARAESELEGRGRLLVRYSGTEDLLRVMVEGQDDGQVRRVASEIATLVREEIGVKRLAE